jgi:hypothetical protein
MKESGWSEYVLDWVLPPKKNAWSKFRSETGSFSTNGPDSERAIHKKEKRSPKSAANENRSKADFGERLKKSDSTY